MLPPDDGGMVSADGRRSEKGTTWKSRCAVQEAGNCSEADMLDCSAKREKPATNRRFRYDDLDQILSPDATQDTQRKAVEPALRTQAMTIQDWGAIGEIVGAVGIIITLIYLATQIRYARIASTDATRQHRVSAIREIETQITSNPEISSAWFKAAAPSLSGMHDPLSEAYDLTPEEARITASIASHWMWTHWAHYRSMRSKEDTEELENLIRHFYTQPPMDLFISLPFVRAHFESDFWNWLDSVLQENTDGA